MNKPTFIKQIFPVDNVWMRHEDKESDTGWYFEKAIALALVEVDLGNSGVVDGVHYLFRSDIEYTDLEEYQNPQHIFFTHEIDPKLLEDSYHDFTRKE